jgi:hypothetical protein
VHTAQKENKNLQKICRKQKAAYLCSPPLKMRLGGADERWF